MLWNLITDILSDPLNILKVSDFESAEVFGTVFFNVGPPKEDIFLTTINGLYFSHQ